MKSLDVICYSVDGIFLEIPRKGIVVYYRTNLNKYINKLNLSIIKKANKPSQIKNLE